MKRALAVLAILALAATVVSAQDPADSRSLSFRISGAVTMLGNPMTGPYTVLPTYGGKGALGEITGQGLYAYQQTGPLGQMVCQAGQSAIRIGATGDVLLLNVTPGLTGTMGPGPIPGLLVWNQTWTGTVVGGTGRFAGAAGTFTKTLAGFAVLPGLVSPFEGTVDIVLDPK